FDRIAFCYDFLKKTVFGAKLDKAAVEFLSYMPDNASVLIIGGGTGEILAELLKSTSTRKITYLEYSHKMIAAAKRRIKNFHDANVDLPEIHFIEGSLENLNSEETFDVVFTPFVLDVIERDALDRFIRAIDT